ncbi:MAG: hypothetical protein ABUL62_22820 [Myxococcales bacterium]|jgi:hypothetical protein
MTGSSSTCQATPTALIGTNGSGRPRQLCATPCQKRFAAKFVSRTRISQRPGRQRLRLRLRCGPTHASPACATHDEELGQVHHVDRRGEA